MSRVGVASVGVWSRHADAVVMCCLVSRWLARVSLEVSEDVKSPKISTDVQSSEVFLGPVSGLKQFQSAQPQQPTR